MIHERIKRARVAAGLSQREAAARADLSAMAISKFEQGQAVPTSSTLIRLARALNTRLEFFLRPITVTLGQPQYRKRASLSGKQLHQLEAQILNQVERFIELLQLFPRPPILPFSVPPSIPAQVDSLDAIEDAADALRSAWALGLNALPSLSDTLEARGVLVLETAVDVSSKFDGLATSVAGYPVIVIGDQWPGDRQRFTIAHELGHLILAGRLPSTLDVEAACDRFAAAFLVPRASVVQSLGEHRNFIAPRELLDLKHAFGLSIRAWVRRAHDVGVISAKTAATLFKTIAARGWNQLEPGDPFPPEHPTLFERLIFHALTEDLISTSKASELLGISSFELSQRMSLEGPNVAHHQ